MGVALILFAVAFSLYQRKRAIPRALAAGREREATRHLRYAEDRFERGRLREDSEFGSGWQALARAIDGFPDSHERVVEDLERLRQLRRRLQEHQMKETQWLNRERTSHRKMVKGLAVLANEACDRCDDPLSTSGANHRHGEVALKTLTHRLLTAERDLNQIEETYEYCVIERMRFHEGQVQAAIRAMQHLDDRMKSKVLYPTEMEGAQLIRRSLEDLNDYHRGHHHAFQTIHADLHRSLADLHSRFTTRGLRIDDPAAQVADRHLRGPDRARYVNGGDTPYPWLHHIETGSPSGWNEPHPRRAQAARLAHAKALLGFEPEALPSRTEVEAAAAKMLGDSDGRGSSSHPGHQQAWQIEEARDLLVETSTRTMARAGAGSLAGVTWRRAGRGVGREHSTTRARRLRHEPKHGMDVPQVEPSEGSWMRDPDDGSLDRWHDGTAWTDRVRPRSTGSPGAWAAGSRSSGLPSAAGESQPSPRGEYPGDSVKVSVVDFQMGRLPMVCYLTGAPATELLPCQAKPPATVKFLESAGNLIDGLPPRAWVTFLPFFLPLMPFVWRGYTKPAIGGVAFYLNGYLPVSAQARRLHVARVRRRHKLRKIAFWVGLVAPYAIVAVAALAGVVASRLIVGLILLCPLVGGACWVGAGLTPTKLRVTTQGDGLWVNIDNAPAAFAEAVAEQRLDSSHWSANEWPYT